MHHFTNLPPMWIQLQNLARSCDILTDYGKCEVRHWGNLCFQQGHTTFHLNR